MPLAPWRDFLRFNRDASGSRTLASLAAIAGLLSLAAPLGDSEHPLLRVGVLLGLTGFLELLHAIRRADASGLRFGLTSAGVTLLMSVLVINAPYIASAAIVLLLAWSFGVDAIGHTTAAWRATTRWGRGLSGLSAAGDLLVFVVLLVLRHESPDWLVAGAAAARMLGIGYRVAVTPVYRVGDAGRTVFDDLDLDRSQAVAAEGLRAEVEAEEASHAASSRRVILSLVMILASIHIARLQPDGSLVGYVSPAAAVLGDMLLAVAFTLAVFVPSRMALLRATRWFERRVWRGYLSTVSRPAWSRRLARGWLKFRLRSGLRLREMSYSVPITVRQGLVTGLPVAAVVAATVPVWGVSWFFDTENWASGIWNSWAESRTDHWRAAMIPAEAGGAITPTTFAVTPPGTSGDFSFIVIGDTGEGDASQHVLRDQLLSVARSEDERFVVISSDVVYPNGSMIDYESKFWLPFKGIDKPVYAIPGNHDWYDALEAFLATFLDPDAARASMRARADADLRLTSTTESRIERLIDEAARLRFEYRVPTGFQRGPFFEIQTERFALLAIDTGIVKRIDDQQWAWLESALARASRKTTMAVVGHPFYAGGFDQTHDNPEFARLKRLLLDHGVEILMAGDTHDLEYYAERTPVRPGAPAGPDRMVHYVVNGGGGAYLSFGTSLQWPDSAPTPEWAYYPDKSSVAAKIDARSPGWKRPAWWWTRRFNAWPFSAEWLSAVFDYNVAPFYQSFVEVRVEPSAGRVRLLPYGVYGRLRWKEVAHSPQPVGRPVADDELVEWMIPMR